MNYCNHCHDGEGGCVYPYHGVAPHECYWRKPGGFEKNKLGTSTLLDKKEWPDNFSEDKECEGLGVYTHCPECGAKEFEAKI